MSIGLNFGVTLYEYAPADVLTIARAAESLGYDSVWCGDHLILPTQIPLRDTAHPDRPTSRVGASSTARVIFPPESPMPDVFVLFSHMAAVTSRLLFGTDIFVLPLRHPMVTARAAGTLDWLSGGRLILGVGLGWLPEEFALAGVPWEERAARTDECIAVMRTLWSEDVPSYDGRFYSFEPCKFEPKPARRGGPAILIGGESAAALRRAAQLGDGWCSRFHTPESMRAHAERLRALRREYRRAELPFEILCGLRRDAASADAEALRDAGATHLIVSMHGIGELDFLLSEMDRMSNELSLTHVEVVG